MSKTLSVGKVPNGSFLEGSPSFTKPPMWTSVSSLGEAKSTHHLMISLPRFEILTESGSAAILKKPGRAGSGVTLMVTVFGLPGVDDGVTPVLACLHETARNRAVTDTARIGLRMLGDPPVPEQLTR